MKLDQMTIQDIIDTPEFRRQIDTDIRKHKSEIELAIRQAEAKGTRLRAHPLLRLYNGYNLELDRFIQSYVDVLSKTSNLSSSERNTVLSIGNVAFNKTVRKFIEEEKTDETKRDKTGRKGN